MRGFFHPDASKWQRMRRCFAPTFLTTLTMLAGCAASGSYQAAPLAAPAAWKEAAPGEQGFWQPAGAGASVQAEWWSAYQDPVLSRLQQQAERGNTTLAQSAARLRSAQAAVGGVSASLFPQLGVNATSARATGAPGSVPANSHNLGLSASWEMDLWGRVAGGVNAAQANAEASAGDVAAARLSIQSLVAQSYFSLRAAEAQQTLLAAVLAAYDESRTLTRNRVEAGVATPSDADQAESQYQSTRAQALQAQATRAQWEHALAALVGEAPANFSLAPTGALPNAPVVPIALPAQLLQRRPDIAAAQARVTAANAQLGVAKAAFFPALTLSANAGYRSSSLASLMSAPNLVWSLGPQLALALFDGGVRTAAREQALADVEGASAVYRGVVITALQEVEDALSSGVSLEQQLQAQSLAVAAAQRTMDVAQNQYRVGIVDYLNVLAAQASLLAGQRSLIELQRQQLVAANTLLKNLGGGWPVALHSPMPMPMLVTLPMTPAQSDR